MADRGFLRIAKGEWVLLSLASASPRLRIGAVRQSLYYRDSIRRMFMRAFA